MRRREFIAWLGGGAVAFAQAAPAQEQNRVQRIGLLMASAAAQVNGGLAAMPDTYLIDHRDQIIQMTAQHRVPAIYTNRLFAAEGGLMSYGFDVLDMYRRAASYADRILRGAHPSELPVQAPTMFQLVINLNTANGLGLTVPPTLLAQADEVIE